jgi:hypothetical protein
MEVLVNAQGEPLLPIRTRGMVVGKVTEPATTQATASLMLGVESVHVDIDIVVDGIDIVGIGIGFISIAMEILGLGTDLVVIDIELIV